MIIPNNYYINVATAPTENARYGEYFCKIELGESLPEEAIEKFRQIKEFFPAEWNLGLYRVTCHVKGVDA